MKKEIKTVLLTGGTGFIGTALSDMLIQNGYHVFIFTRNKANLLKKTHPSKTYFIEWQQVAHMPFSIIINLAGEPIAQTWTPSAKKKIVKSRIETTSELIAFMQKLPIKPELFISGSAVGYYGVDQHAVFTEATPALQSNDLFSRDLCHQWEQAALPAVNLGIRTVFLRIGPVLHNSGGMLAKLWPSFYLGLGGVIGSGQQWLSWIDREDLLRLIAFIIENPAIAGPVNATAPHPITNENFAKAFAASLKRPCFFRIPEVLLKMLFGQMAQEMVLQGQNVMPQKAIDAGFHFLYPTLIQSLEKRIDKDSL